jgi:hypothetical protein
MILFLTGAVFAVGMTSYLLGPKPAPDNDNGHYGSAVPAVQASPWGGDGSRVKSSRVPIDAMVCKVNFHHHLVMSPVAVVGCAMD